MMDSKSYYTISFVTNNFDLDWPGKVKSRSGIFQRAVTWNPLQIRPNLFIMMDRKSYGLMHILEGCNAHRYGQICLVYSCDNCYVTIAALIVISQSRGVFH